jgi:alpha-mannosidase
VYRLGTKRQGTRELVSNLDSLFSVSSPHVIIETIKRAEDGNGIIVRLYESQRKRGPVQLQAGFAIQAAWETNLLEENQAALNMEHNTIQLDLSPYQIMTLRLIPHQAHGNG